MQDLKTSIRQIINEWDPIGLLRIGAPQDEYEPEIDDIMALLPIQDKSKLGALIYDIFYKWFSIELERKACQEVAEKIFSLQLKTLSK